MKRLFVVFLLLFAILFGGIGGGFAWYQYHINSAYVPVEAELIEAHVERQRDKKGVNQRSPEATYRYTFHGNFTAHGISALDFSDDASQIVARIKAAATPPAAPGKLPHITAYVNPADPSKAILLRDYSALPFIFVIPGEICFLIAAGLLIGVVGGGRHRMGAVALDDSAWRLLVPRENLRRQFIDSIFWLAGAALIFGIPFFYWRFMAGQGGAPGIVLGLLLFAALAIAGSVVYGRWSASRHISDARLRVQPVPMRRGEQLSLKVEADAYIPLSVKKIEARLLCTEYYKEKRGRGTTWGTRPVAEFKAVLGSASQVEKGLAVQGAGVLTCKETSPATSTREERKSYPQYDWEIHIHIALEGAADYRAAFPIEVV